MAKTSVVVRIDVDLKKSFEIACKQKGLTQSVVLRELIKNFCKKNAQFELNLDGE